MRISNIFAERKPSILFSFLYNDIIECNRILKLWNDVEYLENYFNDPSRKELVKNYNKTVEEMVLETLDLKDEIEDNLHAFAIGAINDIKFVQLEDGEKVEPIRTKMKYKWLRLYAISVEGEIFIITGGGIKLKGIRFMNECRLLKEELDKLIKGRDFLKSEYLISSDSFDFTEYPEI